MWCLHGSNKKKWQICLNAGDKDIVICCPTRKTDERKSSNLVGTSRDLNLCSIQLTLLLLLMQSAVKVLHVFLKQAAFLKAVTAGGGSTSVHELAALANNLLDSKAGIPLCILRKNTLLPQIFLPHMLLNRLLGIDLEIWKRWSEGKHLILFAFCDGNQISSAMSLLIS